MPICLRTSSPHFAASPAVVLQVWRAAPGSARSPRASSNLEGGKQGRRWPEEELQAQASLCLWETSSVSAPPPLASPPIESLPVSSAWVGCLRITWVGTSSLFSWSYTGILSKGAGSPTVRARRVGQWAPPLLQPPSPLKSSPSCAPRLLGWGSFPWVRGTQSFHEPHGAPTTQLGPLLIPCGNKVQAAEHQTPASGRSPPTLSSVL